MLNENSVVMVDMPTKTAVTRETIEGEVATVELIQVTRTANLTPELEGLRRIGRACAQNRTDGIPGF